MLRRKLIVPACAVALFAALSVNGAYAQSMVADSRTEFTFNAPVELPGVTLPPGTYVFRFADPNTSRKVMQVITKEDNKTYGLFLTIDATRPQPSDEAELRFLETPSGQPAAVKTWWYPGNSIGREFIYPKAQARRLAMRTNATVLTTKAETVPAEQMQTTELARVSPTGQDQVVADVNNAAPSGDVNANTNASNASATTNANASNDTGINRGPVRESQSAANTTSNRRRLPRTNSMLPLLGLMGITSLASGISMRFRG